jgi:hypothetical protein
VTAVVTALVCFALFLLGYEALRRRAGKAQGEKPPVQWGWLAAIAGCAAVAVIVGLIERS